MSDPLLIELLGAINEQSLAGVPEVEIVGHVCERLCALEVPLRRLQIGLDTLHPLFGGKIYRWWRGEGASCEDLGREASAGTAPMWVTSPYYHLLETGGTLYRYRYSAGEESFPFPILAELREQGMTDYIAAVHRLGDAARIGELDCIYASWSADSPLGFSARDAALIEGLGPFLAQALTAGAMRQIARTLVETYLGRDAGERVLRGAIARGVAERIRAVIWFSDLKGFTTMVDSSDPALVLPLLNDYAEPQVAAIHGHGGTVLKFIGDGLLAIFPVGESAAEACGRALAAVDAAFTALDEVSAQRAGAGLPITGAYLALHLGEVFYGNIGGADRLDFTVIGPAVNEAARISAMCRTLDQDVLVSQAFVEAGPDSRGRIVALGSHNLRGVARAQALHAVVPAGAGAGPGAAPRREGG
jgi:adenylate cyclase